MNTHVVPRAEGYGIEIKELSGTVRAWRGETLLAESNRARAMYETRLPAAIYFPAEDVRVDLSDVKELKTFCPFKGTATYQDISLGEERLENAVWRYGTPLPESRDLAGYVGFSQNVVTRMDVGENDLREGQSGNISGPVIDWLLREAFMCKTPEDFTQAFANKLLEHGVAISRLSVMIWSLHPMIAGKNIIWHRDQNEITTFAPSYELYDHPSFINSPLHHVSEGLGGVRQIITSEEQPDAFPIIDDLRAEGATDYVAMPMPFSDGRINVMSVTSDYPGGFTTANLGLVFECAFVVSRFYETFTQRENAQSLLETYVGKRTGARVLGGEIRRGDGDEIDAAIMFCDLRNSTKLEEELGRVKYIELLNNFFECATTQVHAHGGEVLKFIGDAVLAVFPAGDDATQARAQALNAARDIVTALDASGDTSCDCAIGLDYGRVTYGNVGSQERLDFTVIGHAANVAARLGDYGKTQGQRIVATEMFFEDQDNALPLGDVALHNVTAPVTCLAAL